MISIVKYLKSIMPHPLNSSYYIGFLREEEMAMPIAERYSHIRWVDVRGIKNEGWLADPFIYSVNEKYIELFAEEMIYKSGRGILVYLKIDSTTFEILEKSTMLELDTHLSFPIYIEEDGKIYVYPENYQSGGLAIYEFDKESKQLFHSRIIIEAPLLDTQIIKIGRFYYAFGVEYQTGRQIDTKKLFVYKSESLFGKYNPIQTIDNPRCEERGAGMIYLENGCFFRPAQSCEGGYGREVIIYELKNNSIDYFEEIEIKRVIPNRKALNGAILHTYNKLGGWVVIDGWRYHYPHLAFFYKKIRKLNLD